MTRVRYEKQATQDVNHYIHMLRCFHGIRRRSYQLTFLQRMNVGFRDCRENSTKLTCLTSPHVRESRKVLDSGSQPLDSGSQHLDSGFQPFGFRIATFWILDSKPLWIPDFDCKNLPDSGFSYMRRLTETSSNLMYTYIPFEFFF